MPLSFPLKEFPVTVRSSFTWWQSVSSTPPTVCTFVTLTGYAERNEQQLAKNFVLYTPPSLYG